MSRSAMWQAVTLFVLLIPAVQALSASAGSSAAQTKPARPDCSAPEYHQFDFWIGDWDVTSGGKPAGHNRVDAVEDGCAINEHWTGTTGSTGVSYSAYDRADRRWHQFWVSNDGMVLHLTGGLVDGHMALSGQLPDQATGSMRRQRVTWTANADGSVRQLWESQDDNGVWQVVFDGLYRRAGKP